MDKIKLIEPPKEKFSWAGEMEALRVDEAFRTHKKFAKTVSPVISRDMKLKFSEREYTTDTKSEKGFIIIKRIK